MERFFITKSPCQSYVLLVGNKISKCSPDYLHTPRRRVDVVYNHLGCLTDPPQLTGLVVEIGKRRKSLLPHWVKEQSHNCMMPVEVVVV